MTNVIPLHPERNEMCEGCFNDVPLTEMKDVGGGLLYCAKCAADLAEERRCELLAAALDVLGGTR